MLLLSGSSTYLPIYTEWESEGFVLRWSQETHVGKNVANWMETSVENRRMQQRLLTLANLVDRTVKISKANRFVGIRASSLYKDHFNVKSQKKRIRRICLINHANEPQVHCKGPGYTVRKRLKYKTCVIHGNAEGRLHLQKCSSSASSNSIFQSSP